MEREVDPATQRLQRLLAGLGDAIGGSVSESAEVAGLIRSIRDHGYHVYVVLDARIGFDRDRRRAYQSARTDRSSPGSIRSRAPQPGAALSREPLGEPARSAAPKPPIRHQHVVYPPGEVVGFRLNRGDVLFLQALGIDGTRQVRGGRRDLPELIGD